MIAVNIKIWVNTNTHTYFSEAIIFLSILSFLVCYGIEQLIPFFPDLYLTFDDMMRIPCLYLLSIFFIGLTYQLEHLIFLMADWYYSVKEERKIRQQQRLMEKQRSTFVTAKGSGISSHKGFAFS